MAARNDLYEINCMNEESVDEDDEDDEVIYEDLLDSNDIVTSQLASSGPVGLAAAAAIASGKKRRRLHSFETNPSIRKRQQTRLLRKLCNLMEEYIVRVGQQAVIICCSPSKSNQASSFRVYGSQPLEGIVRGRKVNISNDLEKLVSQQADHAESINSNLFELPPLCVEGVPTSLERMTQAQLRYFIPEMLKYATGKSKPGWGKPECRPTWWPVDVPWANVRSDVRDDVTKRETSWTLALRKIVRSCYRHYSREDLLDSLSNQSLTNGYHQQQIYPSSPSLISPIDNSIKVKLETPTIVVQQVTAPDGSIKLVQLDTSGISVIKQAVQPTLNKFPEMRTPRLEFKVEPQSNNVLEGNPKKIIHLTRKRVHPQDAQHTPSILLPISLALNQDSILPRVDNISIVAGGIPGGSDQTPK